MKGLSKAISEWAKQYVNFKHSTEFKIMQEKRMIKEHEENIRTLMEQQRSDLKPGT